MYLDEFSDGCDPVILGLLLGGLLLFAVFYDPGDDKKDTVVATVQTEQVQTTQPTEAATTEAAEDQEEEKKKDDPQVYSLQHNSNIYFVVQDEDTGCQYIQAQGQELVPRLGENGKPLCGDDKVTGKHLVDDKKDEKGNF